VKLFVETFECGWREKLFESGGMSGLNPDKGKLSVKEISISEGIEIFVYLLKTILSPLNSF
jgi:hypothetical protein